MLAVERPLPRARPGFFHGTPLPALLGLATLWALARALLPEAWARVVGLAVAHGGLLGTALAWTSARGEPWAPLQAAALLGAAAGAASLAPGGALLYALVPVWLAWRRPVWLTGFTGRPGPMLLGGTLFGLLLGAHLLVTASLTLGYRVRTGSWAALAGWWAYDAGANVIASEAFFRAALFDRAWRRWRFGTAVALSTAASVTRYLVDPLLPRSLEITAGAAFYLVLLGAGNCWLLARTGSLGPPLAAGLCFFGAYRLLAH